MTPTAWIRARIRLLGPPLLLGFLLVALAVPVFALWYPLTVVSIQTFSLTALCFGFGLLGWSGSVFAGDTIERAQRYLDTEGAWTEASSRRAMARISGVGAGGMLGVVVVVTALGWL